MYMSIFSAPASIEFSINSFTTEAGLSTTSPAAIWSTRFGGNICIFDDISEVDLMLILR